MCSQNYRRFSLAIKSFYNIIFTILDQHGYILVNDFGFRNSFAKYLLDLVENDNNF